MRAPIYLLGLAVLLALPPASAAAREEGDPIIGRALFIRENCSICHGGRGGGAMCVSLRESRPHGDDAIATILNGTENGMPPFNRRLSPRDAAHLVAYIRTLRTDNEPVFTHWWKVVPVR